MNHPTPPPTSFPETRAVILDAAERLFGENGVEGTSIRDITRAANVNLGAIHYHFGTKDDLVISVFMRRLEPLNRDRLQRLDALEQKAAGRPLKLEALLGAFFEPMLQDNEESERTRLYVFPLLSRCFQEPNPKLKELLRQHFEPLCVRFDTALLKAAPGLTPEEGFWCMNFVIGACNHVLDMWTRFDWLPIPEPHQGIQRPERETLVQRLIGFTAGGIRARLSSLKKTS